jgi:hypothetical protein
MNMTSSSSVFLSRLDNDTNHDYILDRFLTFDVLRAVDKSLTLPNWSTMNVSNVDTLQLLLKGDESTIFDVTTKELVRRIRALFAAKNVKMIEPHDIIYQGHTDLCVPECAITILAMQEGRKITDFNPYFLYNIRRLQDQNIGMSAANVLNILYKLGCATNSTYRIHKPMFHSEGDKEITPEILTDAAQHKIAGKGKIYTLETLIHAFMLDRYSEKYKNTFGAFFLVLALYNNSMTPYIRDPHDKLQKSNHSHIEYHCYTIIDFNLELQLLKLRNTWGSDYGDNGCLYFPFSHWLPYMAECRFATRSTELVSIMEKQK